MRSEVFNVPNQKDWPLFTTVAEVRPKFADGTQIQVAIGGWGNTDGFSKAAKTEGSRKLFAANIKTMVDMTGADGVDIDWEYPGGNGEDYKQHSNPEKAWEIEAYTQLLAEIRAAIGPSKIISAAVPGLERDMIAFTNSTLPKIKESVDFLNVMTYDLMNRRDNVTKHHSGTSGSKDALRLYSDRGFRAPELNLGLGFYVKWFKTASNETPSTGADLGKAGAFSWHDEVPPELANSFKRALENGVDDGTGADFRGHYYMDKQERIFWSWDTPSSVCTKLDLFFHVGNNIGGLFVWGLGEDAPRYEHLKAVNKALQAPESETGLWLEDYANDHQEL
ncbi:hypothetical protein EKO04_007078 [Ascochyta lentis]|uniref:chitinase n=1 Tax=Ascochyta lentis TaxID=205686 RepID=A0A8H7MHG3_9PLEO|nr:hypothetical protein EKO04_007078 [Ascochyta lentis]